MSQRALCHTGASHFMSQRTLCHKQEQITSYKIMYLKSTMFRTKTYQKIFKTIQYQINNIQEINI